MEVVVIVKLKQHYKGFNDVFFPTVVGAWLLAILVGVGIGGNFLSKLGPSVLGSLCYSITFYTYAVMITSGLVVHSLFLVECGVQKANPLFLWFARLDGSLTSSIAISFLFNGLIDLKIISEREIST